MSSTMSWLKEPPVWNKFSLRLLTKDKPARKQTSLEDVLENSKSFPLPFPMEEVRCKWLLLKNVTRHILNRNINSAYPLLHENVLRLYGTFLVYKRIMGTTIEKDLYKDMTVLDLINRFLTKRPASFCDPIDSYLLLNGVQGMGNWESVGKQNEIEPLCLKNYLSYDEMKLSAFLSVSSYSYFINNGSRNANGHPAEDRSNLEEEGVVVGLIGPRLHKPEVMEYQDIVISQASQGMDDGDEDEMIRDLFREFYQEKALKYKEVDRLDDSKRFVKMHSAFFDNTVYSKRLAVSFDTLLIEANQRAKDSHKSCYLYVVGIGLGVWRLSGHQEEVFVNTFAERLNVLGSSLSYISDIDFAFFLHTNSVGGCKSGDLFVLDGHPLNGIRIHISQRCPYDKLGDKSKLLVVSYAWDSNSLPGNEFWMDCLCNSSDSATASSSQVSELHNSHINKVVCAENLMVVTKLGLISIQQYIDMINNKISN